MTDVDLTRVQADIAAGRLWKARDRLLGLRSAAPADQGVLELLGRVLADMGDLPGAGLAWFLTEGDDPRRGDALRAMHERHRGPDAVAQALTVRARIDEFPPAVAERLRELSRQVPWWEPRPRRSRPADPKPSALPGLLGVAGCLVAAVVAVVPWIAGIASLLR